MFCPWAEHAWPNERSTRHYGLERLPADNQGMKQSGPVEAGRNGPDCLTAPTLLVQWENNPRTFYDERFRTGSVGNVSGKSLERILREYSGYEIGDQRWH